MTQNRFEQSEIHPRVGTMLRDMGLFFLHEVKAGDGRMDFLAMNPVNGALSVIECKRHSMSPGSIVSQVSQYHRDFNMPCAARWVFLWDIPTKTQSQCFERSGVKHFVVESDAPHSNVKLPQREKNVFYSAFYRFYPFDDRFPIRTPYGRILHPMIADLQKQGLLISGASAPRITFYPYGHIIEENED